MTQDKIWFNMRAAIHNDNVRRERLKPYKLAKALAGLTGKSDGAAIYKQVRQWKRVYDATIEMASAFQYYDNVAKMTWRKRCPSKGRQCVVCGVKFAGNESHCYFSKKDGRMCLKCERRFEDAWNKRKKRMQRQARKARSKSNGTAVATSGSRGRATDGVSS